MLWFFYCILAILHMRFLLYFHLCLNRPCYDTMMTGKGGTPGLLITAKEGWSPGSPMLTLEGSVFLLLSGVKRSRPIFTLRGLEGGVPPCYCLHVGCIDTAGWWERLVTAESGKSSDFPLSLLWTTLAGRRRGQFVTTDWEWEFQILYIFH